MVVLENVFGALTSRDGKDFELIAKAIASQGYLVGGMLIDAIHFLPQSRPRLFIVGVDAHLKLPEFSHTHTPNPAWHPAAMIRAHNRLSAARLMGLPDDYKLPEKYNEAYHLLGDGVVALADAAVKAEFDKLSDEFSLLDEFLKARTSQGLTQAQVAEKIGTTQSAVARMESGSGKHSPSLATLTNRAKQGTPKPVAA
eukprot:gene2099-2053_t